MTPQTAEQIEETSHQTKEATSKHCTSCCSILRILLLDAKVEEINIETKIIMQTGFIDPCYFASRRFYRMINLNLEMDVQSKRGGVVTC